MYSKTLVVNDLHMVLPTHSAISFIPHKSGAHVLVTIKKDTDPEDADMLIEFLDENFKRNGKTSNQWIVKSDEVEDLVNAIDDVLSGANEDESDDELIQEALARRFKSQSSGKHIEEDNVNDSEDEDVISLCRRMRHLYKVIGALKQQVTTLQEQLDV